MGDDISLAIAFDVEQTDNWILNDLEKKKANLERRIKVIKDRWQLSNSGDYISDESNSVGDKSGGRNDSYKSDSDNVSGKNSKKNITNKISEALSQVNNENMEAAAESVTNLEQTAQDNMPKGQIADDKEFADNIDDCKEEPKKKKIQLPTTSIKEEVSAQIEQAIKDLDNKRLNDSEENTQRRYQDESKQESSMEDDTYFSKPKKKKWFKRSEK